MKQGITCLLIAFALVAGPVTASAQNSNWLEEMQQRMQEMQRQMLQELEKSGQGLSDSPNGNQFYFHFDTTFNGDGAQFFQFNMPGRQYA